MRNGKRPSEFPCIPRSSLAPPDAVALAAPGKRVENKPRLPARCAFRTWRMDLARNLKIESVSRLNPTPAWQLAPHQTIAEAVALMRDKKVGCVLVCIDRRVVGIFTERDLTRRVLAPNKPL